MAEGDRVLDYSSIPATELSIEAEPGAVTIIVSRPTGAALALVLVTLVVASVCTVGSFWFAVWYFTIVATQLGPIGLLVGGVAVVACLCCALWLSLLINTLKRPTTFEVRDGRFYVTCPSCFGLRRYEWEAECVGYLDARWGQIRLTRTGAMQARFLRWCSYKKLVTIIDALQRAAAEAQHARMYGR